VRGESDLAVENAGCVEGTVCGEECCRPTTMNSQFTICLPFLGLQDSPALHICNDPQLPSILHLSWKSTVDPASIPHWSWSPGQHHRTSRHHLTIAVT
jgi:hypothetical protein